MRTILFVPGYEMSVPRGLLVRVVPPNRQRQLRGGLHWDGQPQVLRVGSAIPGVTERETDGHHITTALSLPILRGLWISGALTPPSENSFCYRGPSVPRDRHHTHQSYTRV